MHAYAHTHTHTHKHIHTHTHTAMRQAHAHLRTRAHTHTHRNTHTYTHTHTHTHTHTQVTTENGSSKHQFTYDAVFGEDGQEPDLLYPKCVSALVEGLFKGYNATVFACEYTP